MEEVPRGEMCCGSYAVNSGFGRLIGGKGCVVETRGEYSLPGI